MKKTLVSALTTALVVGAASTTFAAANPFADVPADHWAYDAVSQLAADGVIDGYGDGTFRGDRNITRYEMAQMVAKAMAKNPAGADKALVDKLAAEFADELNNLGVRVANLERNADMVKWTGKAEYTFQNWHREKQNDEDKENSNDVVFRLEPTAEVNNHWQVKARLDAKVKLKEDDGTKVELKRVWAQGNYKNFTVKAGKFANTIANDLVFDDPFSGVGVVVGNKFQATLNAGRVSKDTVDSFGTTANYLGLGLNYTTGKFAARAGYQRFGGVNFTESNEKDINANVWSVGGKYTFSKNVALDASYARGNVDYQKTAFNYEIDYKGAQAANKGSWGAWVGYRYLGKGAALDPTYDVVKEGLKGFEIGANYTFLKNIVGTVRYGRGADIATGNNYNSLFGRVEFFF